MLCCCLCLLVGCASCHIQMQEFIGRVVEVESWTCRHLLMYLSHVACKNLLGVKGRHCKIIDESIRLLKLYLKVQEPKKQLIRHDNRSGVTTKGRITIPAKLRKKYKIKPGTHLKAIETQEGILLKPK